MSVGIVVATYGNVEWMKTAQQAIASASTQTIPVPVEYHHGPDLATARNEGAKRLGTEWVIFLDADDSLDERYVEHMLSTEDDSDLRQPSTLGVYPDGSEDDQPVLIPKRDIRTSNYLVIGSMCRREHLLDLGGFDSTLPILEDWDMWIRMILNGAVVGHRPEAIYRVFVNPDSRNQQSSQHGRTYMNIKSKYRARF